MQLISKRVQSGPKRWIDVGRCGGIVAVALSLNGCIHPPGVDVVTPGSTGYVNPDDFRVNSDAYPSYRAVRRVGDIDAPRSPNFAFRLAPIEVTDVWRVTHRIGDRLLIYSTDYENRECVLLQRTAIGLDKGGRGFFDSRCIPHRLFEIFIRADGTVAGGWQTLYNSERVIFASDRLIRFNPPNNVEDWGLQPLFVPIAPNDRVQPTPRGGAADAQR